MKVCTRILCSHRCFTLVLCILSWTHSALANNAPNILLILSDDAGYADFGFNGSTEIPTPNLDRLAQQSTRFTQAYANSAVCGPSRAGLLTGKYPQRFGFEENNVPGYMSASGTTGDDMGLPLNQKTLANFLQAAGYRTAIFGKWHQGNADRFHPLKRGFDKFYGFRGGARSYFPFSEENPNYRREDFLERDFGRYGEAKGYLTDSLIDQTLAFIENTPEQPWFAYVALTAPHAPLEAKAEDLEKFPQLTGKRKIYAAMMANMDHNIGRLLTYLSAHGLDKNTLVIYTNDNGGPSDHNASVNLPLSGTKANHLEGGIRVPMLLRWTGHTQANRLYHQPVSLLDILPTSLAAANQQPPAPIDGVNLFPYLDGTKTEPPHPYLFWKKEVRAAVRHGDWKLIRFPDRQAALFNIAQDPSELNNLANQYPDKVNALYKKLFEWEVTLERPAWQLQHQYEAQAIERMDYYWPINP